MLKVLLFLNFLFMRSVNKVILVGHLAADPEIRQTATGHTVANFKVATNRDWKSADGELHEATDYHRVIAWRKLGEICGEHLKKGTGIYMEGRLMNNQYKDKNGVDRFSTEIVMDMFNFLTSKKVGKTEDIQLVEVEAA